MIVKDKSSISGKSNLFGEFSLNFDSSGSTQTHFIGAKINTFHNLTDLIKGNLRNRTPKGKREYQLTLPDMIEEGANMIGIQFILELPFTLDVRYTSLSGDVSRHKNLSKSGLTELLKKKSQNFHERFEKTFHLKEKGYDESHIKFGQLALSNMLGGIGYFYGESLYHFIYFFIFFYLIFFFFKSIIF